MRYNDNTRILRVFINQLTCTYGHTSRGLLYKFGRFLFLLLRTMIPSSLIMITFVYTNIFPADNDMIDVYFFSRKCHYFELYSYLFFDLN